MCLLKNMCNLQQKYLTLRTKYVYFYRIKTIDLNLQVWYYIVKERETENLEEIKPINRRNDYTIP